MKTEVDRIQITTAEFASFKLTPAGPVSRFLAVLIDHFIIITLTTILLIATALLSVLNAGSATGNYSLMFIFFIGFFILYWFYFFLFEWLNKGRTPGKMIFGLAVLSEEGTRPSARQILMRNLIRIGDMFPLFFLAWLFYIPSYFIGMFVTFFSRYKRLGDLAAGTIVIHESSPARRQQIIVDNERILQIASKMRMKKKVPPDFVSALGEFSSRRHSLQISRLEEIAMVADSYVRESFCAGDIECDSTELMFAAYAYLQKNGFEENRKLQHS